MQLPSHPINISLLDGLNPTAVSERVCTSFTEYNFSSAMSRPISISHTSAEAFVVKKVNSLDHHHITVITINKLTYLFSKLRVIE